MKNQDPFISIIDNMVNSAVEQKIIHLSVTSQQLAGCNIEVDGCSLVNFGSCSYLGLEFDARLRAGVIDAVTRYGTQFASSRAYISAPQYFELETLLAELFQAYPLVSASTTLGHLAAIPVLVGPQDALILDLQVHHSVQLATSQCRLKGCPVEIIPHSRMDALENMIKEFRKKGVQRIWYFADGVYSMYGDFAPIDDIISLLNKYDNFYLYIDDAHGMSWKGKRGRGYVLGQRDIHPKMVVAVSLCKAFAAGGAAIIFPNEEWKNIVRNCGSTLIFSGPMQPPMLGAAVASAKIHLTDEIATLQNELYEKIEYFNQLVDKYNLPLLSKDHTPIRFIGLGLLHVTNNMIQRLMKEGFYTNSAGFPAVPIKRSGIRIVINRHQTYADIEKLIQAISYHLPLALKENKYTLDFIKTFGDALPNKQDFLDKEKSSSADLQEKSKEKLRLISAITIEAIPREIWDERLGNRGAFTWENLQFLEKIFSNTQQPENNWRFHYFIVKDNNDEIVLLSFFISALSKDDMFSPRAVSEKIEQERLRRGDAYYFSSQILQMGSLLSEGNPLFLDKSKAWQAALKILLSYLSDEQEERQLATVLFRDLPPDDDEMKQLMLQQGYVCTPLPDVHIIENKYSDYASYLNDLPKKKRRFIREEVLSKEQHYKLEILDNNTRIPTQQELDYFYQLYKNVKNHSFDVNVYDLPKNIFSECLKTSCWEILVLYLKEGEDNREIPVAMGACLKTPTTYCFMVVGFDYNYIKLHGVYKQMLHQVTKRAIELKLEKIFLGMTDAMQKSRFGARAQEVVAYSQTMEIYKMEVLAQLSVG